MNAKSARKLPIGIMSFVMATHSISRDKGKMLSLPRVSKSVNHQIK